MLKKQIIKILILLISIITIVGFLTYNYISKKKQEISQLKQTISQQDKFIYELYLNLALLEKKVGREIKTEENIVKLSNNKKLKKYNLISGFYAGIYEKFTGSGYIDFYEGNIIVLSSRGVLAFKKNIENTKENFQQINNNISEFIGINQFKKGRWFSLKDIFIFNNKVFVSYTEEIKKDCWNSSVIYGEMNYKNIEFKKLFSPKE